MRLTKLGLPLVSASLIASSAFSFAIAGGYRHVHHGRGLHEAHHRHFSGYRPLITAVLVSTHPVEPVLMTGKGRGGEYQREALIRVRNIGDHSIDHCVSARHERLLAQAHARIVEDPRHRSV